jgi:ubiquinone biosynthesis protein
MSWISSVTTDNKGDMGMREPGLPLGRIVAVTVAAVLALAGATLDRLARRNASFDTLLARRVRRAFERLGPTFVKLGQIIASSSESLPGTWVDEMASCRDDVPPAPWSSISQLLADELGERRYLLLDMDPQPVAAGSMAQVYAARLGNGASVVVKVQRPGLRKVIVEDMRLLRIAARLAVRLSPAWAAANPRALVEDFADRVAEELSFRREATNAHRMRVALASLPVQVPRVFTDLSTDRVLVMERLQGVPAGDVKAIEALGLTGSAIVQTIMASLILPALRQGVFHGDMHSGNMLVLEDGRLGLLDFGIVCNFDLPVRCAVADLFDAIVRGRFGYGALAVFRTVNPNGIDPERVIPQLKAFVAAHLDTSLATLDLREAILGFLRLASKNGLYLPASLVAFLKQMIYIDGLCRPLDPDFDVLGDVAPIVSLARDR